LKNEEAEMENDIEGAGYYLKYCIEIQWLRSGENTVIQYILGDCQKRCNENEEGGCGSK